LGRQFSPHLFQKVGHLDHHVLLNFRNGVGVLLLDSAKDHLPGEVFFAQLHQELLRLDAVNYCLRRNAAHSRRVLATVHHVFFSKHLPRTHLTQPNEGGFLQLVLVLGGPGFAGFCSAGIEERMA